MDIHSKAPKSLSDSFIPTTGLTGSQKTLGTEGKALLPNQTNLVLDNGKAASAFSGQTGGTEKPTLTEPKLDIQDPKNTQKIEQYINNLLDKTEKIATDSSTKPNVFGDGQISLEGLTAMIMQVLAKSSQEQRKLANTTMSASKDAIRVMGEQKIGAMEAKSKESYKAALASAVSELVGGIGGMVPLLGTGIGDATKGMGSIASAKHTKKADEADIASTKWDQAMNLEQKHYDMANDTWSNAASNLQSIQSNCQQIIRDASEARQKTLGNI